jgi:hypothetical protein
VRRLPAASHSGDGSGLPWITSTISRHEYRRSQLEMKAQRLIERRKLSGRGATDPTSQPLCRTGSDLQVVLWICRQVRSWRPAILEGDKLWQR